MTQQQLDDINFTYNPTDEFDDVTEETAEQLLAHDSAAALTSAVMKLTNVIEVLTEKIEQQTGEIMDNTIHIRRMNLEKEENKANHDMSSSPSIDSVVSVHDVESETPSDPLATSPWRPPHNNPPGKPTTTKGKIFPPTPPAHPVLRRPQAGVWLKLRRDHASKPRAIQCLRLRTGFSGRRT